MHAINAHAIRLYICEQDEMFVRSIRQTKIVLVQSRMIDQGLESLNQGRIGCTETIGSLTHIRSATTSQSLRTHPDPFGFLLQAFGMHVVSAIFSKSERSPWHSRLTLLDPILPIWLASRTVVSVLSWLARVPSGSL